MHERRDGLILRRSDRSLLHDSWIAIRAESPTSLWRPENPSSGKRNWTANVGPVAGCRS